MSCTGTICLRKRALPLPRRSRFRCHSNFWSCSSKKRRDTNWLVRTHGECVRIFIASLTYCTCWGGCTSRASVLAKWKWVGILRFISPTWGIYLIFYTYFASKDYRRKEQNIIWRILTNKLRENPSKLLLRWIRLTAWAISLIVRVAFFLESSLRG